MHKSENEPPDMDKISLTKLSHPFGEVEIINEQALTVKYLFLKKFFNFSSQFRFQRV